MSSTTKITLSADELALVTNVEWILTRHSIIQKAYALLTARIPAIQAAFNKDRIDLPAEVAASVPRIFKGEQYRELPYVILDYPRCFEKDNVFALRTMFWWGNFFSITLHLSGKYKSKFEQGILRQLQGGDNDLFVCINTDEWEHHFGESNFISALDMNAEQYTAVLKQNFIKVALRFDLRQWEIMDELLDKGYAKIATLLA